MCQVRKALLLMLSMSLFAGLHSGAFQAQASSIDSRIDDLRYEAEARLALAETRSRFKPDEAWMAPQSHWRGLPENSDWYGRYIYFILTDRFRDGNPDNNFQVEKGGYRTRYGGDIAGIIESLDYLESIGAGAIWITPVQKNRSTDFFGAWAYHGYWIDNFLEMEPHKGTLTELRKLIKKAHARDIKVILDIVVNHAAWDAFPNRPDWFHPPYDIRDWDDQEQLESRALYGMPDFNQDNPEVYDFLLAVTRFWIRETNCDGIRFDAVKHVPIRFWNRYLSELRNTILKDRPDFLLLGEVLHGDPYYAVEYLKTGFDTLFDFPAYYHLARVASGNGSFHALSAELARDFIYPQPEAMVPMLDNHDLPRFASLCTDYPLERLTLALTMLFTMRGIPCITYGTEIPLYGFTEAEARGQMVFEPEGSLVPLIRELARLKRSSPSLARGIQKELFVSDHIWAFARLTESEESIAIFNAGDEYMEIEIPLPACSLARTRTLHSDILNSRLFVQKDGYITGTMPPRSSALLQYSGKHEQRAENIRAHKSRRPEWPSRPALVKYTFRTPEFGLPADYKLVITGSHRMLGRWNPAQAPKMVNSGDGWYETTLLFPEETDMECKLVMMPLPEAGRELSAQWQSGANTVVRTGGQNNTIEIEW